MVVTECPSTKLRGTKTAINYYAGFSEAFVDYAIKNSALKFISNDHGSIELFSKQIIVIAIYDSDLHAFTNLSLWIRWQVDQAVDLRCITHTTCNYFFI